MQDALSGLYGVLPDRLYRAGQLADASNEFSVRGPQDGLRPLTLVAQKFMCILGGARTHGLGFIGPTL